MSLRPPQLDDRDFEALMREALARIRDKSPRWTDHSPSDPGIVLLDAFAYLTDMMIYRLNRVPEKAYVEFLRLMGVTLQPPSAAKARLRFTAEDDATGPVTVPRGARVTVGQGLDDRDPPVFVTAEHARVAPGREAEVIALHAEPVAAELLGTGTGRPGLSLTLRRPPVVAPTGLEGDLIVAVEAGPDETGAGDGDRAPSLQHDGRTFRVWREVDAFAGLDADARAYTVDRVAGRVTFAPAVHEGEEGGTVAASPTALAAVVPAGREVRAWYRRGGGRAGNVRAGTLTVLQDAAPGVEIHHLEPAVGGRDVETLENALVRGPQALHSLQRAVTARDFETVAERSGAVQRAKAFAEASLWRHGAPGTVTLALVPHVASDRLEGGAVTLTSLDASRSEEALLDVRREVELRKPLGTSCRVAWAGCKPVRISARVVVFAEEDADAVRGRVADRLHQLLDPGGERPFGAALRASDVYDVLLREPGVRYADRVRFEVEHAPDADVHAVAADRFQPSTWYAGAGSGVYRTLDDGDGWERLRDVEGFTVTALQPHPTRPGSLAAVLQDDEETRWRLAVSHDCGETWRGRDAELSFRVYDVAWLERGGESVLLLASREGLFQVPLSDASLTPVQVSLGDAGSDVGCYAVAVSVGIRGRTFVAVAADRLGGVFLSDQGGADGTFRRYGLDGTDVRVLTMQADGPRTYLWAGAAAVGGEAGDGCYRRELRLGQDAPSEWLSYREGWQGGSCYELVLADGVAYAATHQGGVLRLDPSAQAPAWKGPPLDAGLPLRDTERLLHPVRSVAADPHGSERLLAGGPSGVYRGDEGIGSWRCVSDRTFVDKVTLPPTWLFCSGRHEIEVQRGDAV